MKKIRWVGFDMDECLGSFSPLYTFIYDIPSMLHDTIPEEEVYYWMEQYIINSEIVGYTWLFRPVMFQALQKVYNAYVHRQIEGAFILSNNGSAALVNFVCRLCNGIIGRMFPSNRPITIFKMSIHANNPHRTPDGIKNFAVIQRCLIANGLPTMANTNDLLFFDDQRHALADEIPHYIQLRPYYNYTDVSILIQSLVQFRHFMDAAKWKQIVQNAVNGQHHDMTFYDRPYEFYSPHTISQFHVFRDDLQVMNNAFHTFLSHYSKTKRNNGSVRQTHEIRRFV